MPLPVDSSPFLDPADPDEWAALARRSLANPVLQAVLESAAGFVLVLDEARRILACNAELQEAIASQGLAFHLGQRPGEALRCVHAGEGPDGYGSSTACGLCGMAQAILAGRDGRAPVVSECSLNLRRNGRLAAVDFQVRTSVLNLGCHALTIVVLQDISARKRQEQLDSIFQHDLSSTTESLIGWSERLADGGTDPRRAARRILDLCQRLRQIVSNQRLLHDAEAGVLAVSMEPVDLHSLIEDLRDHYLEREERDGRRLAIASAEPGTALRSDRGLLLRVLQDLVGNALEAAPPEATVLVRSERSEARVRFHVIHPGVVSEAVAALVFHRRAADDGTDRGLGAFGAKLIGEDYLGGGLSFHCDPAEGTRFTLELPLSGRPAPIRE